MHPLPETACAPLIRDAGRVGDRAQAQLVHEMMLELEDPRPNPLLMNIATGFPSALLCVLAAGALAGALAGRQVSAPVAPPAVVQAARAAPDGTRGNVAAVPSDRHARLRQVELQSLSAAPMSGVPPLLRTAPPR